MNHAHRFVPRPDGRLYGKVRWRNRCTRCGLRQHPIDRAEYLPVGPLCRRCGTPTVDYHGLVRDFGGPRPRIVVLCGSTRFYDEFRRQNLRLTLDGKIVLSVGCDTKSDADLDEIVGDTSGAKAKLDELHKRKIDLADEVLVLNVGGYVGESTRSEIEYAYVHRKPVGWLEPPEPCNGTGRAVEVTP